MFLDERYERLAVPFLNDEHAAFCRASFKEAENPGSVNRVSLNQEIN